MGALSYVAARLGHGNVVNYRIFQEGGRARPIRIWYEPSKNPNSAILRQGVRRFRLLLLSSSLWPSNVVPPAIRRLRRFGRFTGP